MELQVVYDGEGVTVVNCMSGRLPRRYPADLDDASRGDDDDVSPTGPDDDLVGRPLPGPFMVRYCAG